MGTALYLSDTAYDWVKQGARENGMHMGQWVENNYRDWVELRVCIRDSGLVELIEARLDDVRMRSSDSALERGDKSRLRYAAPPTHDGVIWQAMFGAWQRRARELEVSVNCVEALAAWTVRENVVRRRAASDKTLAGQALELIGRGWTSDA